VDAAAFPWRIRSPAAWLLSEARFPDHLILAPMINPSPRFIGSLRLWDQKICSQKHAQPENQPLIDTKKTITF
jgi:hypothetical protein